MTGQEIRGEYNSQTRGVYARFRTNDPTVVPYVGHFRISKSVRISDNVIRVRIPRRKNKKS
jgi:hypothetical protein